MSDNAPFLQGIHLCRDTFGSLHAVGRFRIGAELVHLETQSLRLWSIHPGYLDTAGLVALWREALLAQKVLKGETTGYKSHPQLERFRRSRQPMKAIADYLAGVWAESERRGFNFDHRKIGSRRGAGRLTVTRGQLDYESELLCRKLKKRLREKCPELSSLGQVRPHPLFIVVDGEVEEWERAISDARL